MTDRYAVFGNPIEHSLSPEIHTCFARQAGQDLVYSRQLVEIGCFTDAADRFFAEGGKGLNITVPFKEDACQYAHDLTPRAGRAGAVNTLTLQGDGGVLGDTTDGAGMVRDITGNLDWSIAGKNLLILGAGGAVKGVLEPVLEQQPASVFVANRTARKAEILAEAFCDLGAIYGGGFDAVPGQQFDLIINGTSASLGGDLPPVNGAVIGQQTRCYDMMYSKAPTVFLAWAKTQGAFACADGLGMLVEQAAEAFTLWRGVRPETLPVIEVLRAR